ncbi:hypothetical protein ACOI1C_10305 [Bacillus sp. DJP31]|uniref:hypothetical protein n=1 Tax=Bacillus sp. DJP31 TaxID=3409789 RepID=UPI003BB6523D
MLITFSYLNSDTNAYFYDSNQIVTVIQAGNWETTEGEEVDLSSQEFVSDEISTPIEESNSEPVSTEGEELSEEPNEPESKDESSQSTTDSLTEETPIIEVEEDSKTNASDSDKATPLLDKGEEEVEGEGTLTSKEESINISNVVEDGQ